MPYNKEIQEIIDRWGETFDLKAEVEKEKAKKEDAKNKGVALTFEQKLALAYDKYKTTHDK